MPLPPPPPTTDANSWRDDDEDDDEDAEAPFAQGGEAERCQAFTRGSESAVGVGVGVGVDPADELVAVGAGGGFDPGVATAAGLVVAVEVAVVVELVVVVGAFEISRIRAWACMGCSTATKATRVGGARMRTRAGGGDEAAPVATPDAEAAALGLAVETIGVARGEGVAEVAAAAAAAGVIGEDRPLSSRSACTFLFAAAAPVLLLLLGAEKPVPGPSLVRMMAGGGPTAEDAADAAAAGEAASVGAVAGAAVFQIGGATLPPDPEDSDSCSTALRPLAWLLPLRGTGTTMAEAEAVAVAVVAVATDAGAQVATAAAAAGAVAKSEAVAIEGEDDGAAMVGVEEAATVAAMGKIEGTNKGDEEIEAAAMVADAGTSASALLLFAVYTFSSDDTADGVSC